ncbi:hypothetical protein Nepgr_000634 [Nepenthes gracilis]|uniref:Pectinesterase inhibitor domain-containing protein n=1 Tax=Nepenthes gracilis TaxID=150966 RepID=A0AAD3P4S4_NEPGR|nr:hypothetical protein Nepgr_000634 [Nepenthes gracilis]
MPSLSSLHSSILLAMVIAVLATVPPSLVSSKADPKTQDLIDSICRQMPQYQFCNQTFNNNLKSPSSDVFALTRITLEQSLLNATSTLSFIQNLTSSETDKAVLDKLQVCENGYSIVKNMFEEASKEFEQQDYDGVIKSERATVRPQTSCITIFNTPPPSTNPLLQRNDDMQLLITMALATCSLIGRL